MHACMHACVYVCMYVGRYVCMSRVYTAWDALCNIEYVQTLHDVTHMMYIIILHCNP